MLDLSEPAASQRFSHHFQKGKRSRGEKKGEGEDRTNQVRNFWKKSFGSFTDWQHITFNPQNKDNLAASRVINAKAEVC